MREISNGTMQLKLNNLTDRIEIYLSAEQVQENVLVTINNYLSLDSNLFLRGHIEHQDDGSYKLTYQNPGKLMSLRNTASQASYIDRLKLSLAVIDLIALPHYRFIMFLNPRNILVAPGERLLVAHRGIRELLDPRELTSTEKLKQIKAMIISIVVKQVEFDEIINDTDLIGSNKFAAKILSLPSLEAVKDYLLKLAQTESERRNKVIKTMPKWLYDLLRWGSVTLAVITVLIGLSWGISLHHNHEQQLALKSANSYLDGRYQDAVDVMKGQDPSQLSLEAQYVLAGSYVQLANLSNQQKQKFSAQLSPNSDNNLLMYWISDGQKDYTGELNYGKKINDNELILHAYQQLLGSVKDNGSINGEKKQKLLKNYQDEINKYQKKVNPPKKH
ncbi:type VII secretion protein EssB/YukC [Fructilactobacillus florum]|uniref:Type VII secretion protein EssB n=1 Tax=Fructilactobacillus florum DSM 22689 = JCM 16035 TaxID=1423745 RepID=A0A0R2CJ26_9LACO|nr:type VII secretion protein EssB/YukC [Fructilactobacillus florum]KRM91349.1 hypothetical protein FC87_GL000858 [Fructilactobacillus florum DSM 22689 = JCM 16035]